MHDPASSDIQRLAGDESRCVGGEEGERFGDVVGGTAALDRLMIEHEARIGVRVGTDFLGVGRKGTGSDRVDGDAVDPELARPGRSEEHTSELNALMRTSSAVFCLKK